MTRSRPFNELYADTEITEAKKQILVPLHATLNTFELKKEIKKKVKLIFQYARPNNKPKNKV